MIDKTPLPSDALDHSSIDTRNLRTACRDYVTIEAEAAKRDNLTHYAKPTHSRLRSGKSVLIQVTDIDGDLDTSNEAVTITGTLDYSILNFDDIDEAKSSIRIRGQSDTTSGSFMHAVPLDHRQIRSQYTSPHQRYRAPMVTVQSIDLNDEEIVLEYLDFRNDGGPYVKSQHRFTATQPGSFETELSEGTRLLLEPGYNNFTAQKAFEAMTLPYNNAVIDTYNALINATYNNSTRQFDHDTMAAFTDWLAADPDMLGPNDRQDEFITDARQEIVALQGPPGTGKTSGALAPGIISRLLSHHTPHPWGMITGPSHKATNETLDSVIDIIDAYRASDATDDALDDIQIYRLAETPDDTAYIDRDYLTYDPLYEETGVITSLASEMAQSERSHPVLVFATPGKAWRLTMEIGKTITGSTHDDIENLVQTAAKHGLFNVFNIYAADEASMLTLPQFFMAGAQYHGNGAILVSGDHRQLPPVQQHAWDTEFRPSIRSVAPFLSTLDFTRLLTEDPTNVLDDDLAELLHDDLNRTKIGISIHRLEESYRNHTQLADFLRQTVYEQDGIPYRSSQTNTITTPRSRTHGVDTVTRPSEPVVLVTYDDTSSQQANKTEALLTGEILDAIREEDIGIVTPHNAQRALLQNTFATSYPGVDNRNPDIATINRFQGGERDVIVMNGTVSDPDYIDSESEFLLNLNRINVALSRMRKKLVIVVAESIFSYIPSDTHEYEDTTVWKSLARVSGYADTATDPAWSGSLGEFVSQSPTSLPNRVADDTPLSVYYVHP